MRSTRLNALLVWGGDVLYLRYWMQQSGLADLFASLRPELVYVGVSAGSMVVTSHIGETYTDHKPPPAAISDRKTSCCLHRRGSTST
jgi:peptidase E